MNVYENVPLFPEFSNSTCYAGRLVSALCVEQIAATSWNNRRELAETHMASLNATVLAQDFTFDICKRIFVKDPDTNAQINPYNGLSIVMNENSQVVWCVFSLPRELFIDCSRGLRNAAPSKTPCRRIRRPRGLRIVSPSRTPHRPRGLRMHRPRGLRMHCPRGPGKSSPSRTPYHPRRLRHARCGRVRGEHKLLGSKYGSKCTLKTCKCGEALDAHEVEKRGPYCNRLVPALAIGGDAEAAAEPAVAVVPGVAVAAAPAALAKNAPWGEKPQNGGWIKFCKKCGRASRDHGGVCAGNFGWTKCTKTANC